MGRGRKPKERKGYFYELEEDSVARYIETENMAEKNKIFNEILLPAFTKMIESIIRRYKLYVPDEEFQQTFDDTISYLLTKIHNFKPNNGTKAYSYCGTICKNYLLFKIQQFNKEQQKLTSYDTVADVFETDDRYTTEIDNKSEIAGQMIKGVSQEISKTLENKRNTLTESEVKVGNALLELLENWEEILATDTNEGSNKIQKSNVLYFLREITHMSTKEVRDNMKPYKKLYFLLKKSAIE